MSTPKPFETTIAQAKDGKVYLPLPFDPAQAWGANARHVGGHIGPWNIRGVAETFDGHPGVVIGAAWRRDCGLSPGDKVAAALAPEGPHRKDLPADIAGALAAEPAAAAFFDAVAPFYRKAYLTWADTNLRKPDVRAARVAQMVALLKAGEKERP